MGNKEMILKFLQECLIGVIATVNKRNRPESAVMGYGITEKLELIFGTNKSTRKYKNLLRGFHIAFSIGWDENITVQYEGEAQELSGADEKLYKAIYHAKNPDAKKYENDVGQTYFKVVPTWIKYTDYNKEPEKIIELTFRPNTGIKSP